MKALKSGGDISVHFSGGEPGLFSSFHTLVSRLAITWSVTTSLHPWQPWEKFLDFPLSRCRMLDISYHAHLWPETSAFVRLVRKLEQVYPIRVSYVEGLDVKPLREMGIYPSINIQGYAPPQRVLCNAGVDYASIDPYGNVWRCTSHMEFQNQDGLLGNLFTGFSSLEKERSCYLPCAWCYVEEQFLTKRYDYAQDAAYISDFSLPKEHNQSVN